MARNYYYVILTASLLFFSRLAFATDCGLYADSGSATVVGHVEPSQGLEREQPAFEKTKFKNPIEEDFAASQFPAVEIGRVEGADLFYSGPSDPRALLHGINRNWPVAEEVLVFPKLRFSSKWAPSGHEFCSKHKTKRNQARVCVEKQVAYDPTHVTVQLVNEGSKIIYEKRFTNLNDFTNSEMSFPAIRCPGPLLNFDIRVRNFEGGTANFRIHRVSFFGTYR